eukprot:TRINITY_DN18703_c0_g1_i2.p1 TRINITY_DN18703_c0_g1~~TRINITY_DN18703_c0_g1_i2.p1  ORF type:complete len:180 (-),score=48.71 TRINITY_DN18703_c0_g1_i2:213-752(-)
MLDDESFSLESPQKAAAACLEELEDGDLETCRELLHAEIAAQVGLFRQGGMTPLASARGSSQTIQLLPPEAWKKIHDAFRVAGGVEVATSATVTDRPSVSAATLSPRTISASNRMKIHSAFVFPGASGAVLTSDPKPCEAGEDRFTSTRGKHAAAKTSDFRTIPASAWAKIHEAFRIPE